MAPTRRDFLLGTTALGASTLLPGCGDGPSDAADTGSGPANRGAASNPGYWEGGWRADGVLNAYFDGDARILQAGSEVYPSDRRSVAFLEDVRFLDGAVEADIAAAGAGAGLVIRRSLPFFYYALIYQAETGLLELVRHLGRPEGVGEVNADAFAGFLLPSNETVLAATITQPLGAFSGPARMVLAAESVGGVTQLTGRLQGPGGPEFSVTASDDAPELQQPGEAGLLATAVSVFPSGPNIPNMTSTRALTVTDQGLAFMASPPGQAYLQVVEQASTAQFANVSIAPAELSEASPAHVLTATTLEPIGNGALVTVSTDLPAQLVIDYADNPDFAGAVSLNAGHTNGFDALFAKIPGFAGAPRVYWRARSERQGRTVIGPVRSFRSMPKGAIEQPLKFIFGSCATQMTWTFRHIRDEQPDGLVWLGDLNYPDAMGLLAQTESAYTGLWKDFLAARELRDILDTACFLPQRDDHDYGLNDSYGETVPEHGITTWEGIVHPGTYYRYDAGPLGVWVLDQRRFQDDPALPDTVDKSMLGPAQRDWLLETLAASDQPFKIVGAPMPLFLAPNPNQDWSKGFTAERDYILDFIRTQVSGRVIFVSGDSHSGAVIEQDGIIDIRSSPLDIPSPGWVTASEGEGVIWSDVGKFYCVAETGQANGRPFLDMRMVRVGIVVNSGQGIGTGLPAVAGSDFGLTDEHITEIVWQQRFE